MKHINSILFIVWSSIILAQPKLTFSESKKILVLDDESEDANKVVLKSNFTSAGTKKLSSLWNISGTKNRDWEIVSGDEKSEQVTIEFNKVGLYTVSHSTTFSKTKTLKDGSKEEEEDEISVEKENLITVTNNLDELTQIYADSSFVKLVKKAADYAVKPKYIGDPTPHIFLAKGYFGMYRKNLKSTAIPDPLEEALASTATAIEMDLNGIFNAPIHKIWLNKFQNEIININILYNLDEKNNFPVFYQGDNPERKNELNAKMIEGIEQYLSITKNPISAKFLEAAIRFNAKDSKTSSLIWKNEIPNLLKLESVDNLTETDQKVLKIGIILSAQMLQIKDGNSTDACSILNKANDWFGKQKDFYSYYERVMNKCQQK
jgi:hypothetical protein